MGAQMLMCRDKFLGLEMPPCHAQAHSQTNAAGAGVELCEDEVWDVLFDPQDNCEEDEDSNRTVLMDNLQLTRLQMNRSHPMKVPPWPFSVKSRRRWVVRAEVGEDDERERMPPHMQVALCNVQMGSALSVMEGAGRTLKGRDLCNVRNAVWRCTGFIS